MQEYNDGTFGQIKDNEEIKKLFEPVKEMEDELARTKSIHFGTEEELQAKKEIAAIVEWYGETLLDVHKKLDMIIKHFNIVRIIGDG